MANTQSSETTEYPLKEMSHNPRNAIERTIARISSRLARDGPSPRLLCQKARLLEKLGRLSDAFDNYSAAIALNVDDAKCRSLRAWLGLSIGRYALALEDFTYLIHRREACRSYLGRARVYREMHLYQEAQKDIFAAMRCDTASSIAHYELAQLYLEIHRFDDAVCELTHALAIERKSSYYYARAFAKCCTRSFPSAAVDLDCCESTGAARAEYFWLGGIVAYRLGDQCLAHDRFVTAMSDTRSRYAAECVLWCHCVGQLASKNERSEWLLEVADAGTQRSFDVVESWHSIVAREFLGLTTLSDAVLHLLSDDPHGVNGTAPVGLLLLWLGSNDLSRETAGNVLRSLDLTQVDSIYRSIIASYLDEDRTRPVSIR